MIYEHEEALKITVTVQHLDERQVQLSITSFVGNEKKLDRFVVLEEGQDISAVLPFKMVIGLE